MFIYWISGESGCLVSSTDASKAVGQKFVTHADYRELEERYEALKVTEREGYAEYHRTRVELASIKALVLELVAAAENTLVVEKRYGIGGSASDRLSSALEAFK